MNTAVVPVKSAWASKTNWTQAIAVIAMILSFFGFDLDVATQTAILAGIIGVQATITWILRTFFTDSITPSVAAK